ncbi:hypothetical protein GCM10010299_75730 [Streptomyces tanashiensis]|nr:hypothetical protein GCM10010299_75730 [Streptomyces tanashiensis]
MNPHYDRSTTTSPGRGGHGKGAGAKRGGSGKGRERKGRARKGGGDPSERFAAPLRVREDYFTTVMRSAAGTGSGLAAEEWAAR